MLLVKGHRVAQFIDQCGDVTCELWIREVLAYGFLFVRHVRDEKRPRLLDEVDEPFRARTQQLDHALQPVVSARLTRAQSFVREQGHDRLGELIEGYPRDVL